MGPIEAFGYSRIFERPIDLHLAFRRSVDADVAFARELFSKHTGFNARSVLEVQCGPAYYAAAFAEIARTVAVDTRQDTLDFARALHPDKPIEFRLQHPCSLDLGERFDLVLFPLDSVTYLTADEALMRFFEGAASSLTDEGLLLVEANHPRDVGYIDYGSIFAGEDPRFPGLRVRAEWGVNDPSYDLITHEVQTVIRITVEENGAKRERLVESLERQRVPREMELLVRESPLELVSCHGGWTAERLSWEHDLQLFVFKRRSS